MVHQRIEYRKVEEVVVVAVVVVGFNRLAYFIAVSMVVEVEVAPSERNNLNIKNKSKTNRLPPLIFKSMG